RVTRVVTIGFMEPVELHRRLCDLISGDTVRGQKIYLTSGALCMRTPEQARAGEAGFYHPDLYGRGPAIWLWRKVAGKVDHYAEEVRTKRHQYAWCDDRALRGKARFTLPHSTTTTLRLTGPAQPDISTLLGSG